MSLEESLSPGPVRPPERDDHPVPEGADQPIPERDDQPVSEETDGPTLSVVLPTMNEEAAVADCIRSVRSAVERLGVTSEIIVSDSSTDRTPDIARDLGATVVEPDRPGYGYAYRYAFEVASGEYVAIGDADRTYDFAELPKLFDRVAHGDADVAMGSRLSGDIEAGAMPPLHRYVGNPLLTRFLNLFYDAGVTDAHSGFRVLSREAIEAMDLGSDGMEFASEMVMEAAARDLTIEEVPITYRRRAGEATLDSFRDGWRHVRFMLVNAPGYLFTVPGTAMGVVGAMVMTLAFFGVSVGTVGFGVHSMIAGSLLTIVGYQVASMGVFATVAGDPIRAPSDPVTTWLVDRLRLEHGAMAGTAMFGVGGVYASYLVVRWVASGFSVLPFVMGDVVAFTLVILGVQTVFGSFFLSVLADL